ncbi:esterase [Paecilomyces variotii No. 5]|uniref:S-formylglutathione hydrolase n=1 Tax=Byssochlamys spectabilis (strain No. 5 / NBRC 109023) TaxID=1356009 RepID=V5G9Q2_BYSSN|nr:esterase [Paecilomyces variotii No. 5]
MVITTKATIASFGGKLLKLSHMATSTGCEMNFNLYLPPQAFDKPQGKIPVLIYLSGLTCTADNCSEKGFFQHGASKNGIAVLYPDTSPRGLNIPGEDDSWDFGTGAGFYVDATREPYNKGYNMYTYVTDELPNTIFEEFPQLDSKRVSITGHSMGGHGALMLGTGDNFYKQGQLLPENLEKAAAEAGIKGLHIRYQPDYDHSYYTMASFADDHIAHAAHYLK